VETPHRGENCDEGYFETTGKRRNITNHMSNSSHYIIEPLDPAKHRREGFDCGVDALNDYLKKRARKEMDAGLAVCFVAVPESDPGCIAGFYTLSAATILTTALPEAATKKLPRYGQFPATLLGRLARSADFKGQGVGDRLMMSAFARAAHAAEDVASWAILTDPKDDNARRFYEEFGFSDLDANRLFMSMKQVKTLLSANAP
jgi:GNAT superfamily N-acetyltransferase